MTTAAVPSARRVSVAAAVAVAGCVLLLVRSWTVRVGDPVAAVVVTFGLLALAAVASLTAAEHPSREASCGGAPGPETTHPRAGTVLGALAVGLAVVVGAGLFVGSRPTVALGARFVVLDIGAAIAEELFFRRFVYSWLRPAGASFAIVVTACVFALVHVTEYGWWVVPLDLAAGLLFGWQREASGTWTVPALTHVVANLMVVL